MLHLHTSLQIVLQGEFQILTHMKIHMTISIFYERFSATLSRTLSKNKEIRGVFF